MSAGTTIKVTVTAAQSTNYEAASATYTLTITKASDTISWTETTVNYDGNGHGVTNLKATSGLTPSITYYSDSSCSQATTTDNATSAGGMPKNVGVYYAKASTAGNGNYNAGSKACTKAVTINKATNPISVTASQTWNTTYFPLSQNFVAYEITPASNAQGSVSYEIISQSKSDGTTSYFTLEGTKLLMPGGPKTGVGVYTIVIRATAAGNDNYNPGSKDITMKVTVSKFTNTIKVSTPQTWELSYSAVNQTKNITAASNAIGSVTYSIIKQVRNSDGQDISKFSLNGTALTMTGGTVADNYTVVIRATAAGDDNVNPGSKDITVSVTVKPVEVKITFDVNGNTLAMSDAEGFTPDGGVSATCSGGAYTQTCTCSIGNAYGCGIQSPKIRILVGSSDGFSTSSAGGSTIVWKYGDQKTIYYDTPSTTYYAQSSQTYTATFSWSDSPGIASSTSSSQSCTIYNNSSSTCTINTLPTLTATTGNTVDGWYDSSGNKVTSISLSSDQTFTARANITAAGVTYTDTYSIGCSTVQCAIDKINSMLK